MNGRGRLIAGAVILAATLGVSLWCAHAWNEPYRPIVGGYYLYRFDAGGPPPLYYLGSADKAVGGGGGVLGGVILKVGWNRRLILAKVFKVYRGDPDGWYIVNVKSGKITGPLGQPTLNADLSRWHIKVIRPGALYAGWWYGPERHAKRTRGTAGKPAPATQ